MGVKLLQFHSGGVVEESKITPPKKNRRCCVFLPTTSALFLCFHQQHFPIFPPLLCVFTNNFRSSCVFFTNNIFDFILKFIL